MKDLNDLQYPKKINLREGTEIILRPMVAEDEDKLLEFFRAIPEEDRIYLADDVTSRKVIRRWCKELDYNTVLPILAEKDGVIIGDSTLRHTRLGWMRHVGHIRSVVSIDWRRKGVATVLVGELIEHAIMRGLDKLVFRAMDTQVSAINAMKAMGFVKEAVLKEHVVDLRGRPHDLIIMTNYVSELWKKMEDLILDSEFEVIP
jgi:RimJ/RimL family protein N-acetyltransferase